VLTGKGNGGGVGVLLWSRDIEGEERRGAGGLVRAMPCGGKRREHPGSIVPRGWRTAWAMLEGVGWPRKGGSWAGPERTVPILISTKFSN
jgi:hypothetical protein